MHISIKTCIFNNRQLLGVNFTNLGQTKHSFWGGYKIFLSYNNQTGWKVCKLNIFQRFLRQILGLYKETRFEHVYEAWRKEKKVHADLKKDHPLNLHMKSIWQKRYLIALGTSTPADAKVFCFAETHGDIKSRKAFANIIETYYRPGDIILIEGGEAGKIYESEVREIEKSEFTMNFPYNIFRTLSNKISAYFSSPTQAHTIKAKDKWTKYLKGNHNVQGWEPKGIQKLHKEAFRATNEMHDQLLQLNNEIIGNIPKTDNYTEKDLIRLKQIFKKLNKEFPILAEHFLIDPKKIENMLKSMNEYLELLETKDEAMNIRVFKCIILDIFCELEKNHEKASYYHIKDKELIEKIWDTIKERNIVKCEKIDEFRQMGKKVFIFGGAGHYLTFHYDRRKDLVDTRARLNKHPYIIYTKRSDYMNNKLSILNPDLKEVAQ